MKPFFDVTKKIIIFFLTKTLFLYTEKFSQQSIKEKKKKKFLTTTMINEYSIWLYRRGIFKIGNSIFKNKKRVKQVLRHVHSINNERIKFKVKRVNLYGQGNTWNRETSLWISIGWTNDSPLYKLYIEFIIIRISHMVKM